VSFGAGTDGLVSGGNTVGTGATRRSACVHIVGAGVDAPAWCSLALPVEGTVGQFVALCTLSKLWDTSHMDGEDKGEDREEWDSLA